MKKTLYPKTKRIGNTSTVITEKLDGSNLGIFKVGGELLIAQRNNIFKVEELNKDNAYKGLIAWLDKYKDTLDLNEGSGVFGEWIGMGHINYSDSLDKRFYIFAKANINSELEVRNINYNIELFKYPFTSQVIPECMGVVPIVEESPYGTNINGLNELYEVYKAKVNRDVEGFIIQSNGQITKYVRHKDGKPLEHKPGK